MTAAALRQRTRTEIDRDLIAACRRLGAIALAAELGLTAPTRADVARIAEGLRRTLAEREAVAGGAA